jgi:hypothetical protein
VLKWISLDLGIVFPKLQRFRLRGNWPAVRFISTVECQNLSEAKSAGVTIVQSRVHGQSFPGREFVPFLTTKRSVSAVIGSRLHHLMPLPSETGLGHKCTCTKLTADSTQLNGTDECACAGDDTIIDAVWVSVGCCKVDVTSASNGHSPKPPIRTAKF